MISPYQLYFQLQEIEHTRTKARHPQTNGICERFQKTVLDEFYKSIFRKKIFSDTVDLQAKLDSWMEALIDGLELAKKAKLMEQEIPAA